MIRDLLASISVVGIVFIGFVYLRDVLDAMRTFAEWLQ